jgi:DNA-binding NarL/FixJ family response regulator
MDGDQVEDGRQVTILLADGHSLFREAVKAALESQGDLTVVAEAGDGHEAVSEAERTKPDIALLDLHLPNCNGIRTALLVRDRVPDSRVVVLATEEDQESLVEAVEAGASGYLTKECPLSELIDAARAISNGETLIPKHMLGALLSRLILRRRQQDAALRQMARLTKREKEVLALLAHGADNDAIAQQLVISPQTARTHIQNVIGKLGVHSRLEAAAFVLQNGIHDDLVGAEG